MSPPASLPANEVARLFASLRRLRAQGVGMIYVSHRLDEVFEIADRIVVLRDGRVVGERSSAGTGPEEIILLIVGREPSQIFRRPAQRAGSARLELAALSVGDVGPIDCRLHAGEIVGLVGLRGRGTGKRGARSVRTRIADSRADLAGRPANHAGLAAPGNAAGYQSDLRRPDG